MSGALAVCHFSPLSVCAQLDSPREWFADFAEHKLYYMPNGTAPPPSTVIVPRLATLISITGDAQQQATGVTLRGLTFTHSLTTFLGEYEVPSGGDWSMHRGGAIFATGTAGLLVEGCHFDRLGGNGLMLSAKNRDATISGSEFSWIGDNAIAQMGTVKFDRTENMDPMSNDLMDATDGYHPEGTTVQSCLFREIGVYGKQVSAFASALSFKTTINGSIFYNGPRAGINWNDGMGGGNSITCVLLLAPYVTHAHSCSISRGACDVADVAGVGMRGRQNLLFNWVRETSDHGVSSHFRSHRPDCDIHSPGHDIVSSERA